MGGFVLFLAVWTAIQIAIVWAMSRIARARRAAEADRVRAHGQAYPLIPDVKS